MAAKESRVWKIAVNDHDMDTAYVKSVRSREALWLMGWVRSDGRVSCHGIRFMVERT